MSRASAFGERWHIPLPHQPPMAGSKLAMHGFHHRLLLRSQTDVTPSQTSAYAPVVFTTS